MTEEEFDFAVNEAVIYFDDNLLVVGFGTGGEATMELGDEDERALVRSLLSDANLWASFLGSLSAAIGKHK